MGRDRLLKLQNRASRKWYRPSSQLGMARESRFRKRWLPIPGLSRWYGLAYHHDRWTWRRRMGRRWNRSRVRHAGTKYFYGLASSCRIQIDRATPSIDHRNRLGADLHEHAEKERSSWQVRGVLRRRMPKPQLD
jgi:hypothetical protein